MAWSSSGAVTGDGTVEVVGVGGAEGGDVHAGLGPGGGVLGVGVDDGADGRELAIEEGVGVEVGGGLEVAFDDGAVEVGDDHVLGAEVVVVDAGGLDDDEALGAVDAGGVAEGVEDEAFADQFEVGFEDFGAELFEEHEGILCEPEQLRSGGGCAAGSFTRVWSAVSGYAPCGIE